MEPRTRRHSVAAALFGARLVYAYNWYDIGAVLPRVQAGLGASVAELGIVLGAFLAGVALFQLPAGFAALRWGSGRCSIFGLVLMGAACLASGLASTVLLLALLRFVAGVGAAFFFAPGLALIADHYPAGERGPVIGLYNGAFSGGGAAGLFLGALAGATIGWPFALGVGGVALLATAGGLTIVLQPNLRAPIVRPIRELWSRGVRVLRSRSLWALAFGLTGFWAAVYIVAQYLVQFAHDARPGWGLGTAAALAAAVVVISLPGGPIGGWLGERSRDPRVIMVVFAGTTGSIVFLVPFAPLWVLVPALLALGLCDGIVFAIQYLMPLGFAASMDEGLALGIGFINMVQVVVGSGITVLFAYLIAFAGYPTAWIMTGAVCLGTLPLLALVERVPHAPGRPVPSPGSIPAPRS
jgi:MFS family permease